MYADAKRWKVEILSRSETGLGGTKEVIAMIEGRGAYSRLKYESGVHRVQRVPATEAQGRIHTSTVTVAVMPEAEEVDVQIEPDDLRIDVFRSSGPGRPERQHHRLRGADHAHADRTRRPVPGREVPAEEQVEGAEDPALAALRRGDRRNASPSAPTLRRSQVGTGDRSERIRTYNFPQNRVTDHRIGLTVHQLSSVLDGGFDPFIDALTSQAQVEALRKTG